MSSLLRARERGCCRHQFLHFVCCCTVLRCIASSLFFLRRFPLIYVGHLYKGSSETKLFVENRFKAHPTCWVCHGLTASPLISSSSSGFLSDLLSFLERVRQGLLCISPLQAFRHIKAVPPPPAWICAGLQESVSWLQFIIQKIYIVTCMNDYRRGLDW
jgi:hypothetical protein